MLDDDLDGGHGRGLEGNRRGILETKAWRSGPGPPVGKKKPLGVTTVYLPITDEEQAEIKRLDNQAEDA